MDAATYYQLLGRLIEEMPIIPDAGPIPAPVMQWLGRADALIAHAKASNIRADWSSTQSFFGSHRGWAIQQFQLILYRALAEAELAAPASSRGSFIPAASPFDAFAALGKLLQQATSDVLVVDPYLDETILTEFETLVPANVPLRLLSDEHFHKPALIPALAKWVQQYGTARQVSLRLAPPKSLHDRAIILDNRSAWTLTQSLKDFAKRSPAEIVSAGDIANLKIPAYQQIWSQAKPAP